ncbi:MAG: pyridoxal kinase [Hyphomonadaceae bacterium]|nr:pyridoxal kinase [Hyphomonadaceae bacterium]
MKTVLSISSQVAGAMVGASVGVFAMQRLGVRVLSLPTVLFARRPDRGPPHGTKIQASLLADLVEGLRADGKLDGVDGVLSGYMASEEQIEVVLQAVDLVKTANPDAIYLCDPIMGDDGALYVPDPVARGVVEGLVRQADWIAPNAWELSLIAGRPCASAEDAQSAARRLGKPALISSIPSGNGIGALYVGPGSHGGANSGDWLCVTPRLPSAPKGAGDLLTALWFARRLLGAPVALALEGAVGAVHDVILRSLAAGGDDLALPDAHDLLAEPRTWPTALPLGG